MTDADFHRTIARIRRGHYAHFLLQGGLMAGLVLATGPRAAPGGAPNPQLATWPVLLGTLGALAVVGVLLHFVAGYIRPSLRRPAAENLRLYQVHLFLRNSLLALACLPPLAAYTLRGEVWNLLFFTCLLLVPGLVAAPSARTYQRWLLARSR